MSSKQKDLASRLSQVLLEKNTTPYQIEQATGTSQSTIGRIISGETKKPNANTLKPICKYLGISVEWLKTGKGLKDEVFGKSIGPEVIDIANKSSEDIGLNYSKMQIINHLGDNWREYMYVPAFKDLIKVLANKMSYENEILKEIRELKAMLKEMSQK